MAPISDRTWKGSQSWNREVIETLGERKLRLQIKYDAYVAQSYGVAEVWTGDEWKTVHRISGYLLAGKASYTARDLPAKTFDPDLAELRRVVKEVV